MGTRSIGRAFVAVFLGFCCLHSPARALVKLAGGTDEVFLNSTAAVGYDSNLFANANGSGDFSYSLSLGLEYTRNAGLITLKATATVTSTRYDKFTSENFNNPALLAEFSKKTGRTTGSLALGAVKESRADAAVNIRSESWHYSADLKARHPVNDRYSLLGSAGYSRRDFTDNSLLSDLDSYTAGMDLAYSLRTGRDLLAGYQFREDETSANVRNTDHAFTVGLNGQILPRLSGSIRGGYNFRVPHNTKDGDYSSWTGNAALNWNYNQRASLNAQLAKAFSTTATSISTDTLSTTLRGTYAMNARVTLSAGTGWTNSDFLGQLGGNRHDDSWSWDVGVNYIINPHLNASLSYVWMENWSTLAFADFTRRTVTLTISARF